MALSNWLLLGGALWVIKSISNKSDKELNNEHQKYLNEFEKSKHNKGRLEKIEKARRNTPCNFNEGISNEEFNQIIYKAQKRIKRIKKVEINNATIMCTVESQTGYSTWNFYVDFNDWGHITGVFWRSSDNIDSNIPKYFEEMVSSEICELLHSRNAVRMSFANLVYSNLNKTTMSSFGTSYKPKPLKEFFSKKHYINTLVNSSMLTNEHIYVVLSILKSNGFINIKSLPIKDINTASNNYIYQVAYVSINGYNQIQAGTNIQDNTEIIIYYHDKQEITTSFSGKTFKRQNCYDVEKQLRTLGFSNITLKPMKDLSVGWLNKEGMVSKVYFKGNEESTFQKNEIYEYDKPIVIKYHSFKK